MKQLFNVNGQVYGFLNSMYQFMLLNILIVLMSLPMITLPGALITGYQLLKEKDSQEVHMKRFFVLFKKNLLLSFKLTIVFLLVFFLLFLLLAFTRGTIFQFLILLFIAFFIVFFSNACILSENQITIRPLLRLSLGITLKFAGFYSIGLGILISSLFIPIFLPKLGLLWALFGLSIPMFLQVCIHQQMMKRITIKSIPQG